MLRRCLSCGTETDRARTARDQLNESRERGDKKEMDAMEINPKLGITQAKVESSSETSVEDQQDLASPKLEDTFGAELRDANGDLSCDSIFSYSAELDAEARIESTPIIATDLAGDLSSSPASSQPVTYVTQSRFFTPLFNAAIFDGPIRIYFAQAQESLAMKLYFNLQERYGDLRQAAREIFRERGSNVFVMLYPDAATFEKSFGFDFDDLGEASPQQNLGQGVGAETGAKHQPSASSQVATGAPIPQTILTDRMGSDYVVGVRGPILDVSFDALCAQIEKIIRRA